MTEPPVIAIDGPTASGKGTIAHAVAAQLGFACLDSGALYRLLAVLAARQGVDLDDAERLAQLARRMRPRFTDARVELDGEDLSGAIRSEQAGRAASRLAAHPAVRAELLALQHSMRRWPGLVADGRDMGTVVFTDARLKVFLTASVEARAQRRFNQLIEKGYSANLSSLLVDLRARDERDRNRAVAPLRPAEDAYRLDTTDLSIEEVVAQVLSWYRALP